MKLIKPTTRFKDEYLDMLQEWKATKEEMVPFSLAYDVSDFEKFLTTNEQHETHPEKGFVPHTTFWLINDIHQIIGTTNIRHQLNDSLFIENGHIGYGIRPHFRRQGFATKILALSLKEAKNFGIKKALLTCDKTNIGSHKAILKNGGILREEQIVDGREILSFWINIDKSEDEELVKL